MTRQRPTVQAVEPISIGVREAAKAIGIGLTSAWKLTNDGAWPSYRVGDRVLIPVDGLRQWVDDQVAAERTAR